MSLRNKRILITAGPTWVPIDQVRMISNIATGETGNFLAKEAKRRGAKVTLLQGPLAFDELRKGVQKELRLHRYDAVIHSAAVSDFRPAQKIKGKLVSGRGYTLKLLPLPKISNDIKRISPKAKLIMFKLEAGLSDKSLIQKAKYFRVNAGADIIVANRLNPYRAFIIDKTNGTLAIKTKPELAKKIISKLAQEL